MPEDDCILSVGMDWLPLIDQPSISMSQPFLPLFHPTPKKINLHLKGGVTLVNSKNQTFWVFAIKTLYLCRFFMKMHDSKSKHQVNISSLAWANQFVSVVCAVRGQGVRMGL